ncbi:MAG TPA: menaquinone biosynthesis decarboxylase [Bacteroidales bacterium]
MQRFVEKLEARGELIRIKEFVDPILEIAEFTDRISKMPGGGKAILFENTGTAFPVLTNAMGSDKRICEALHTKSLDEIGHRIDKLFHIFSSPKNTIWQKLSLLPQLKEVSNWMPRKKRGRGVCQQAVMQEPDLSKLPILKCWPGDGGRFVTLPLVNTIDPDSGIRNIGMYRMQVFAKDKTGMHWHMHKTGARHYEAYKKAGEKMPVTVVLGGDPAIIYAATAPLPDNIDEYILAGFLQNKPVELVKCLTNELWVPSEADIIIEGYVDPKEEKLWEGPFGDHTGFYSEPDWYPAFHVTCITHRRDAIYPATIVGVPPQEDAYIAKATERIFLSPMRFALAPEVEDIYLPAEGVAHNLAIVKINKTYPGQAFKVMNALWGAGQMMFNKTMIVTDGNVDIFNPISVLEACAENVFQTHHICFQEGPADILDHAGKAFGFSGKMCIDATRKMPQEIIAPFDNNVYSEKEAEIFIDQINNIENICSANSLKTKNGKTLVFAGFKKETPGDVRTFISKLKNSTYLPSLLGIILFDKNTVLGHFSYLSWLTLSNIDATRDCFVVEHQRGITLIIDATSKSLEKDNFNRQWPAIIMSSDETIKNIDKKWSILTKLPFVHSPTLLSKKQSGIQE